MEWIDPIYNCGHWIPFQIAQAGGIDMLNNPAGDSIVIPWEKMGRYNPEVLIIAPCGFSTLRTLQEMHLLTQREGWQKLEAVKKDQVFVVDFEFFTQPSASTLADGIELLGSLFHPELFSLLPKHNSKFKKISGLKIHSFQ